MSKSMILVLSVWLFLAPTGAALAYIGPGAGISVVGSLLGILATFVVAIGAILIWPLRKLMKRRKAAHDTPAGPESAQTHVPGSGDDDFRDRN